MVKGIAKIFRGIATRAQMMMACVLGAGLGFMPGFAQASGLIVLLALLLIELAALALATVLFNIPLLTAELLLIVFVGTLGYVSLTTLLSTLGGGVRSRAVLLPALGSQAFFFCLSPRFPDGIRWQSLPPRDSKPACV